MLLLGTGGANGVPAFYCDCVACKEAERDAECHRTRCSALVQGSRNVLIDASPDLRGQLLCNGVREVDALLLTHSHYDHAGGVPELEFYVRLARQVPIPTYLSAESAEYVRTVLYYLEDCLDLHVVAPGDTFKIDGARYTVLEATHAPGTLGFLIETPSGRRTGYLPDTGPLPAATAEKLAGADTLVLGALFFGRNWMHEDHLNVDQAVAIGRELGVKQLVLTHLSMHYDTPVTCAELDEHLRALGEGLVQGRDGMRLEL
ncbi:MAG: MBL fold metallo-hydrolase [Coriobacteriia bacterium]